MNSLVQLRGVALTTIVGAAVLVGGGGGVALYIWLGKNRNRLATSPKGDWKLVGTVAEPLYIYPIKSGKALPLTSSEATEIGLKEIITEDNPFSRRDRLFLVYDPATHEKVTARTYPKLMTLQLTAISANEVEIFSHLREDLGFLRVKIPSGPTDAYINMWNTEVVRGIDCGDTAAKWVSQFARSKPDGLRLAYFPENQRRRLTHYYKKFLKTFPYITDKSGGAFSDTAAYHIVNNASVRDLNARLAEADRVTPAVFRPNIAIDGAEPYAEDNWDWLKIGEDAVFRVISPSIRCSMTTINPMTLERNVNYEPVKTLQTYRPLKTKEERALYSHYGEPPIMGINCSVHAQGIIKAGDPVYISE